MRKQTQDVLLTNELHFTSLDNIRNLMVCRIREKEKYKEISKSILGEVVMKVISIKGK